MNTTRIEVRPSFSRQANLHYVFVADNSLHTFYSRLTIGPAELVQAICEAETILTLVL